jgi:hypothetical protein
MKVRALPTWRKPVGEGAKRTRGGAETAEIGSGIVNHDAKTLRLLSGIRGPGDSSCDSITTQFSTLFRKDAEMGGAGI